MQRTILRIVEYMTGILIAKKATCRDFELSIVNCNYSHF
jgi:hypothetical protein